MFKASALAEEEGCLGLDRSEEVHDGGGVGAPHAEVDGGDVVGGGARHVGAGVYYGCALHCAESFEVVAKVGE